MKLRKIKLSDLSDAGLRDRELNALRGGYLGCKCSCYWSDKGGSSSDDNMSANYHLGDNAHSKDGCNQYWSVGSGSLTCNTCNESNSGL